MFWATLACAFVSSVAKLALDRDTVQTMAFSQACSSSCLLLRGTECRPMQQICSITRPSSLARHGLNLRCNSVWTHLSSSCRNSTGPCSADHSSNSRFGRSGARRQRVQRSATGGENGQGKDDLENYVEVKIESVRVSQGASVVYLRVVGSEGVIPVHIGENESNALLREINKQRQVRPLTHDLMKNMLQEVGFRVTKVRVTDIIANTYYARVHVARAGGEGEVDVDARPSDAINLAVRFGAPVYIAKKIAESAAPAPIEQYPASSESHAEIVRSVRETLANYEDPTIMYQLQKELAVKEERFEDAQQFQESIVHEMTHNRLLRLVVAMESALADGRYEEAAHLRDEYKKVVQQSQTADRKAL